MTTMAIKHTPPTIKAVTIGLDTVDLPVDAAALVEAIRSTRSLCGDEPLVALSTLLRGRPDGLHYDVVAIADSIDRVDHLSQHRYGGMPDEATPSMVEDLHADALAELLGLLGVTA